jgi:hypothetical protein
MPLQGPLVVISEKPAGDLIAAFTKAGAFPVVESRWVDSVAAITSIQPAAVVISELDSVDIKIETAFGQQIARAQPYVPVIARVQDNTRLAYSGALPIAADAPTESLIARLVAALRVRELHATVLRRVDTLELEHEAIPKLSKGDPLDDATVLVLGRGRSYPTLSVLVGERVGVIGALSVETAGRCLGARQIDGIVIGDGFSVKIIDAFLLVLADDPRFRDLAIGVLGDGVMPPQMPNILRERDPARLVQRMLALTRLHAFDGQLKRMLKSIECKGMLDPETGLLNENAFAQDLARAIDQVDERGGALSIARFSFEGPLDRRTGMDAARVISRLMRTVDFACRQDDGSILAVFTATDLRTAHVVARRLASVLKHTMLRSEPDRPQACPNVTLATLKPNDTLLTLMARVTPRTVAAE